MKESLKLAVELAKRGESEGIGTVYRETCADVYFRARLMMGNRGEARELDDQHSAGYDEDGEMALYSSL